MSKSIESSHANSTPHKSEGGLGHDVMDFLHGAAYAAIQAPIDGLTQIADEVTQTHLPHLELIDAPTDNSIFTTAGKIVGTVADFVALQAGAAALAPSLLGEAASAPLWLKMGLTGAAFEATMPTSSKGNYLLNKARDVGIGFGTFAAMGAVAQSLAPAMGSSLESSVEAGAEEGIAGGSADAGLSDLLHWQRPGLHDLSTIARWTAFGTLLGATSFIGDGIKANLGDSNSNPEQSIEEKPAQPASDTSNAQTVEQSIKTNQDIFNQAGESDGVVAAQKQLYNVQFRQVTNADGEMVPTLENPQGEQVDQGHWVAQRLDANGQPVVENGQLNQWPITEDKILKTYNVQPETLSSQTEFTAPTRVDGPLAYVTQLKAPLTIQTSWGSMHGEPGDWLSNYDYNPTTNTPGNDYAIISGTSFKQTYQIAK